APVDPALGFHLPDREHAPSAAGALDDRAGPVFLAHHPRHLSQGHRPRDLLAGRGVPRLFLRRDGHDQHAANEEEARLMRARRLRYILRKELTQMFRDRATFGLMVVTPVLQLFIYGYVASLDIRQMPLVVCDLSRSQESRSLVERFTTSGYFELVATVPSSSG